MQTRKRAKSVMFGKKTKEKKAEKVEETPKEKVSAVEPEKVSEKAGVVERRVVPDKPQIDELSVTPEAPSAVEEKPEAPEISTPSDEFVSDNPLSATPEPAPTLGAQGEEPSNQQNEQTIEPISPPVANETPEVTISAPVATPSAQSSTQELSSTLPPSAFTIQEGDTPSLQVKPEEAKKHAGVYFFVIAFLAFILGLGAMAAVSYFGLITPPSRFASNIHIPALLGAKPTPTSMPTPTAAPTTATVNLQAYTIAILNGSGVTGAAGKEQTALNTAGFKVASTGNADKSDYTKTEISAKKSVDQAYMAKLEDELKKSFAVDDTIGTSEDSSASDITVIIGTSTAQ